MSEKRRRKSLSIFRPPLSGLTPIDEPPDTAPPAMLQKKNRTGQMPFSSSPLSGSPVDGSSDMPQPSPTSTKRLSSKASLERLIPKSRPRSLQKAGRPSSLFGSLRSLHSLQDEDENTLTRTVSTPTSLISPGYLTELAASQVLYSGEVQMSSGMFRRKSQYVVLTDTHLVRFKSQTRASEVFPTVPSSLGRSSGNRHSRMSSSGSLHELHSPNSLSSSSSSSSSSEGAAPVPLNQIVAVYKLDDGRPYFSIEVAHLDDETMQASTLILQLHDPRDFDLWLSSIRTAITKARLTYPLEFTQPLVEYVVRALAQERDYNPNQFHMFKIVQRATKSGSRSSSDDLSKLTSNICILAIGIYKIHLVPLPKMSKTASSTSLSDMMGKTHGVATLTSLTMQDLDDSFTLGFRLPLRQPNTLSLASSSSFDIARWLRQATEYVRPQWLEQPFLWNVPQNLDNEFLPIPSSSSEDHQAFDRTLVAYCSAYELDTSKISYFVDYDCEDGPGFELLPPADRRQKYTALELLAVMRALRYNETFGCISFNNISLDPLYNCYDRCGYDHTPWSTRSGESLNWPQQSEFTLLVQELQGLALKNRKLRRMDFSHSISRKPVGDPGFNTRQDPGCGICEALFPLCAKQYTNLDWIVLDGIVLSDIDIDYLFSGAIERSSHFRAIDIAYCGLTERPMLTVLNAISHQGATMESLNLSGNPARLEPNWHEQLDTFGFLRKVRLSGITRTSDPDPILPFMLLQQWKLEELRLDKTILNPESVTAIAKYLADPQSETLRVLQLDQCQLTGTLAAILLHGMSKGREAARDLHLWLSGNRLQQGHSDFTDAIARDQAPTHLTLQMLEYSAEDDFRGLLAAFVDNKGVRMLDISRASLPEDATEETCTVLRQVFESNSSLEYLDISGEKSHLEATSLGSGLNDALTGLKKNETLKALRIEHQSLGLHGISELSSVLEENHTLQEIYCEDNEVNLQAFTVLVNGMERNTTIQFIPDMSCDRALALKRVDQEVESFREGNPMSFAAMTSTKATVKRTLGRTISGQKLPRTMERANDFDVREAVSSLSANWDREVARLQKYLTRNQNLLHGLPFDADAPPKLELDRPGTSGSLSRALQDLSMEKTPTAELDRQLSAEDVEKHAVITSEESVEDADDIDAALEINQTLHDAHI